jgi:hypothetical protein
MGGGTADWPDGLRQTIGGVPRNENVTFHCRATTTTRRRSTMMHDCLHLNCLHLRLCDLRGLVVVFDK